MRLSTLSRWAFILCATSLLHAADPSDLPADVQKVADKADAAVAAVAKTAEAQMDKIKAQEIKDLQRLHDATKKSDQVRAQAILAKIEAIKSSMAPPAPILLVADGQKVAFLGDSITQFGWGKPTGYVNEVVAGLEANGIKVNPIPAGISGNTSNDMLGRVDNDVLSKKPDWLTVSCGVNDVWHGANGVPLDQYKEKITAILDKAKAAGTRVMILTSTVIGEDLPNANNVKLADYNDFLRALAKERGLPLADLNADMQAAIKEGGKPGTNLLTVDGVHMNDAGNQLMARGILRAFGLGKPQMAKAEAAWPDAGDRSKK
jgi:lysophospholipase L1-like esterase